jgi:cytoskeletal protein CcmA (bactofilin family)
MKREADVETILDADSRLQGEIVADGDLMIEGLVEGSIQANGKVVIAGGARVRGPVSAAEVEVIGTVEGDITSRGHLLLAQTGRITGDVRAHHMRVEDGGIMRGKVLTKVNAPPEPRQ